MFETMKRSVFHVAGFLASLQSTLLCIHITGNSLLKICSVLYLL